MVFISCETIPTKISTSGDYPCSCSVWWDKKCMGTQFYLYIGILMTTWRNSVSISQVRNLEHRDVI